MISNVSNGETVTLVGNGVCMTKCTKMLEIVRRRIDNVNSIVNYKLSGILVNNCNRGQ